MERRETGEKPGLQIEAAQIDPILAVDVSMVNPGGEDDRAYIYYRDGGSWTQAFNQRGPFACQRVYASIRGGDSD